MEQLIQDLEEFEFVHLSFDWPLFLQDQLSGIQGYSIAYYYGGDSDAFKNATLDLFKMGVSSVLINYFLTLQLS